MSCARALLSASVSSVVLMLQLVMLLSASTDITADAAITDDSQLAVLNYLLLASKLPAFAVNRKLSICNLSKGLPFFPKSKRRETCRCIYAENGLHFSVCECDAFKTYENSVV